MFTAIYQPPECNATGADGVMLLCYLPLHEPFFLQLWLTSVMGLARFHCVLHL